MHQDATTIQIQPWSRRGIKLYDLLRIAGGTLAHRPPKNQDVISDQRPNGNGPGVRKVEIDHDQRAKSKNAETLKLKKRVYSRGGTAGEGF